MDPILTPIIATLAFAGGTVFGRKNAPETTQIVYRDNPMPPPADIDLDGLPDGFDFDDFNLDDFMEGLTEEELEALRALMETDVVDKLPIAAPVIKIVKQYVYKLRTVNVSPAPEDEKEEPIVLRHFQEEVRAFADVHNDALFIYPTGTGKTVMITAIIADLIEANPGYSNIVIFSPKIFLANQMLLRVRRELRNRELDVEYSLVNSKVLTSEDRFYMRRALRLSDDVTRDELIEPTTSSVALANKAKQAERRNVPHLISSTYHSHGVIIEAGIKLLGRIFDEAHHTAADPNNGKENHSGSVVNMTSEHSYGFSATHREHEDVIISRNELSKTVKEMVNAGEMVPPRLSEVVADSPDPSQNVDGRVMEDAFMEWRRLSNTAGVRMLAGARRATNGNSHIRQLSEYANKMRETRPHLKVFDTSSEDGCFINGVAVSDLQFQFELYEHCSDDRNEAIIVHYDILTEGYDVPTLSGVLFFGKASRRRAIQMIGRVLRLHDHDRKRLYNETIAPGDTNKMVKPFGMVAYAYYGEAGEDVRTSVVDVVQEMRTLEEIRQTFVVSPQSRENVRIRRPRHPDGYLVPNTDVLEFDDYLGNVEQKHEEEKRAKAIYKRREKIRESNVDNVIDLLLDLTQEK